MSIKKRLFTLALGLAVIAGGQWNLADLHGAETAESPRINDADLIGKWAGELEAQAESTPQKEKKSFELVFSKEAAKWSAVCSFNVNGHDSSNTREVLVKGDEVSFRCNIGNSEWAFKGRLQEGKLKGNLEIFEHEKRVAKGTWSAGRPKK